MNGFSVDGMRQALRRLASTPSCLLCAGAADDLICAGCRADLPWNHLACPRCAQPLAVPPARVCATCAAQTPAFDSAVAAFRYQAPVAGAVQALKYHADFLAARWLGEGLAETIQCRAQPLPQILLPVPLHRARLRKRGFNQAQELARVLTRRLHLASYPGWSRRLHDTPDQIGLSAAERRRNVKDAFMVDARIAGKRVALIDDVMTTGSTLAELTRACLKAGASGVELWVAARAE